MMIVHARRQCPDRPARPLRVGVFVEAPIGTPVSPEVKQAVRTAAALCETMGHVVEEIPCPFEGGGRRRLSEVLGASRLVVSMDGAAVAALGLRPGEGRALDERTRAVLRARQRPRADVIRAALTAYVELPDGVLDERPVERVRDLLGSVEGMPVDLATHADRYLADLGRRRR